MNQLVGRLFPRELPGAQQSVFPLPPVERVLVFETQHRAGYLFRPAGVYGQYAGAAHFGHGRGVSRNDGSAAGHGFHQRDAETLAQRGVEEGERGVIQRGEVGVADVARIVEVLFQGVADAFLLKQAVYAAFCEVGDE